jgi:CRISPR/Cas system CSM-associated protein Csm2 small subunit
LEGKRIEMEITSLLDEKGNIHKHLLSECGGNDDVSKDAEKMSKRNVSETQVRNFYQEIISILNSPSEDSVKKTRLIIQKAIIEYKAKSIGYDLKKFLNDRINIVLKAEDEKFIANLRAFQLNFQSLIAYLKKYSNQKNQNGETDSN